MMRTEDRLTDALHAAARSVREETLRPLEAPAPARRRWALRLAPAAAAACVALVIVLVAVVVPMIGRTPSSQTGTAAAPPPFYIATGYPRLEVRSTVTGAVTGTIPTPGDGSGTSRQTMTPEAVTPVGSSGREFIAAFVTAQPGPNLTRLYSFRLSGEGHITHLAVIRGGTLDGLAVFQPYDMAVSPDASKLVVSACRLIPNSSTCPDEVVVINLKTGAHTLWAGGLGSGTRDFGILDVGWAPGGGSVTFMTTRCFGLAIQCSAGPAPPSQLRELSLSTRGGSLTNSSVLFTASALDPYLLQAQLSNDGRTIVLLEEYGPIKNGVRSCRVVQVPIAAGQPRLPDQDLPGAYQFSGLRLSPSGQYVLLTGATAAWIHHGELHAMPGESAGQTWW